MAKNSGGTRLSSTNGRASSAPATTGGADMRAAAPTTQALNKSEKKATGAKVLTSDNDIKKYVNKLVGKEGSTNYIDGGVDRIEGDTLRLYASDKADGNYDWTETYNSNYNGKQSLKGDDYEAKATRLSQLLNKKTGGKIKNVEIYVDYYL